MAVAGMREEGAASAGETGPAGEAAQTRPLPMAKAPADADTAAEYGRGAARAQEVLAGSVLGREVGAVASPPCTLTPTLTWRKMAGLYVTGLHLPGPGQLQAPAAAGRPKGTDDLAPPSPPAATLRTLGPTGWAWEERTGSQKETPRLGVPARKRGRGKVMQVRPGMVTRPATHQRPKGPGLGNRDDGGSGQALTRPQAPTCQVWSWMGEQSSRTQGSVMGGRSSEEHAVAWSRDPSSLWQVTLRLRTPAPQLTEHCKDQAVGGSWSSPGGAEQG